MTDTINSILAIDIGGTSVKTTVLDVEGKQLVEYQKLPTPKPANPENILKTIRQLVANFPPYDRISVGFPGYVKNDVVYTAPNLDAESWKKIAFADQLTQALGKPAKVINDADMQGLGIVSGKGLELMITLGTGFGTAFLNDGKLLPHLELAHHPITKTKTYDEYIGDKALIKEGDEKWNERMKRVLDVLKTVFNYDRLYIGGGNAKKIKFSLDSNITIVTNKEAIDGGVKLWKMEQA
jgi:polyphosphate glucokinase